MVRNFCQALFFSFKRIIGYVLALQAISWVFDTDKLIHEWIKLNPAVTTFIFIGAILYNAIVWDLRQVTQRNQLRANLVSPPRDEDS